MTPIIQCYPPLSSNNHEQSNGKINPMQYEAFNTNMDSSVSFLMQKHFYTPQKKVDIA